MNKLFISTSFLGKYKSDIQKALNILEILDVYGCELASTHKYSELFKETVLNSSIKQLLVHNYCPPAKEELVLNIASQDDRICKESVDHIKLCIRFAKEVNAGLYTFHPGFSYDPSGKNPSDRNYDFNFTESIYDYDKAFEQMLRSLEEILGYAQRYSVPLAIETQGSICKSNMLIMQRPEEYESLFQHFGGELGINLNMPHTALAAKFFGFGVADFISLVSSRLKAVEISHCDLVDDQHLPLVQDSFVFDYFRLLPADIPFILEFRNASVSDLKWSLELIQERLNAKNSQRRSFSHFS